MQSMLTQNVSFHGLLVYAQPPPPIGQLLRLTLALSDDVLVTVHGVPVRWAATLHGRSFAVGVRLIGVPAQWDRFVTELRASAVSAIRLVDPRVGGAVPVRRA